MKTPQNYRSPLHVKIPRETLVFMKKHQANIKKKPLFWWIVTSTLFFSSRTSYFFVILLRNSITWLKTKLAHNKCRTAHLKQVSDSEIGSKKITLCWVCLGWVPHILDTWLGNCSNTISIRNSYCLRASAFPSYTPRQQRREKYLS